MRVLQVGKFYPPHIGGIEVVIFELTEALNSLGIHCDVLCSNHEPYFKVERIKNYVVYRAKSYGKLFSTSVSPQMILLLKRLADSYDIVHLHHPDPMAAISYLLARPSRPKLVFHWHSDILRQKRLFYFYRPFLNAVLRKASVILCTSYDYLRGSEQLEGFKEKCKVVPLGISTEKLRWNPKKVTEIRNSFSGKKIVYSLGRFIYYKGYEYLIEAMKDVREDVVLLLGGEGPLKGHYETLVEKFGLRDRVFFLGRVPQELLGTYYAACDVFCLPSVEKTEAFGLVVIEAMSLGKPVVTTRVEGSGIGWVNLHGVSGLTVPPRDPKALAEAINTLLGDEELYRRLSKGARERFEAEFSSEVMARRTLSLYQELLS